MVGDSTVQRPSHAILNCGLDFSHFQAPFYVYDPHFQYTDGFVSVGDALDFAVRGHTRTGGTWSVGDANGEHVYTVGS